MKSPNVQHLELVTLARRPGSSVGLPGYAWDPLLRNYVNVSTGRMVKRREISDLLRSVVDEAGQAMREIGRLAAAGEISPREFYEAMQITVRQAYNASAALGKGGWAQMTQADWGTNGYRLRLEYERLRDFAQALEAGELSEAQAGARAKLYADSAFGRYWEIRQEAEKNAGTQRARLRTVGDERVCFPAWTMVKTSQGGVPIQRLTAGMQVLTRTGLHPVVAVTRRSYSGAMTTVDAGLLSVTATSDHPFWTLERGWLNCGSIQRGYSVQTFGQQLVKVWRVRNFVLGNPHHAPAIGVQVGVLAAVFGGVAMPEDAVSFKSHAQVWKQEVNTVAANANLLTVRDVQRVERLPNSDFEGGFGLRAPVTGEAAELVTDGTGTATERLATRGAFDVQRRAAAFLRTVVSVKVLFGTEYLAAALAGLVLRFRRPALAAANRVTIRIDLSYGKRLSALGTRLGDTGFGSGSVVALDRAKAFAPGDTGAFPVDGLSAAFASDFSPPFMTSSGIARPAAKHALGLSASRTFKNLATVATNSLCHYAPLLTRFSLFYQQLCGVTTTVYDIEVAGEHEFYANGVLVHNCDICRAEEAKGWQPIDEIRMPTLHAGCRCEVTFEQ